MISQDKLAKTRRDMTPEQRVFMEEMLKGYGVAEFVRQKSFADN